MGGRRQIVPLGVGRATCVDRQRTRIEARSIDAQDKRGGCGFWAVVDDPCQGAHPAIGDACTQAGDGEIGRVGGPDGDIAQGNGKRASRLGSIDTAVADHDRVSVGVA